MLPELFANVPSPGSASPQPEALLATAVSTTPAAGTVETWTTGAAAQVPLQAAQGQWRGIIDNEEILVDASTSGTTSWHVTRGVNGTAPAVHLAGTPIYHFLSAAALGEFAQKGADGYVGTPGQGGTQLTPSVGSAGSPFANGAVIDLLTDFSNTGPGSDNTTELQTAINQLVTAGGGEIVLSKKGDWGIDGAPQTGTAQGYSYNGQLLLPAVGVNQQTAGVAVRIRGALPANGGGVGRGSSGVRLVSNATSGYVFDAIPGYTFSGFPWTSVVPIFKDLILVLPSDPQCGGVNAQACPQLQTDYFYIQTPYFGAGQTLTGSLEGIVMPQLDNAGNITLSNTEIRNVPIGVRLTEHGVFYWLGIYYTKGAFAVGQGAHTNYFAKVDLADNIAEFIRDAKSGSGVVKVRGWADWENTSGVHKAMIDQSYDGKAAIAGTLDWSQIGNGGGGLLLGTPGNTASVGQIDLSNSNFYGKSGWMSKHPADTFMRPVILTTSAPGVSYPSLTPWLLHQGSFQVASNALTSTNGTTQARALIPAKNNGESRSVSATVITSSGGTHVRLYLNWIVGGASTGGWIGLDIGGAGVGKLQLQVNTSGGGQQTIYTTAANFFTPGSTYTFTGELLCDKAGVPKRVRCYQSGVSGAVIDYQLTAAQQANLVASTSPPTNVLNGSSGSVYDGIGFFNQTDQVTAFWVQPAEEADYLPAASGTATLVAGTVTIANTAITTSSIIRLSRQAAGGTLGDLSVALTAGASFTINSNSSTDTSTVYYEIVSY